MDQNKCVSCGESPYTITPEQAEEMFPGCKEAWDTEEGEYSEATFSVLPSDEGPAILGADVKNGNVLTWSNIGADADAPFWDSI